MDLEDDGLMETATRINSRVDFHRFLRKLVTNLRERPHEWDNSTLEQYLEGITGFAQDMDGYFDIRSESVNAENPTWRLFAEMLLAARTYE
jgi:hypothetical protein